jgi:hypothetical protein
MTILYIFLDINIYDNIFNINFKKRLLNKFFGEFNT